MYDACTEKTRTEPQTLVVRETHDSKDHKICKVQRSSDAGIYIHCKP